MKFVKLQGNKGKGISFTIYLGLYWHLTSCTGTGIRNTCIWRQWLTDWLTKSGILDQSPVPSVVNGSLGSVGEFPVSLPWAAPGSHSPCRLRTFLEHPGGWSSGPSPLPPPRPMRRGRCAGPHRCSLPPTAAPEPGHFLRRMWEKQQL